MKHSRLEKHVSYKIHLFYIHSACIQRVLAALSDECSSKVSAKPLQNDETKTKKKIAYGFILFMMKAYWVNGCKNGMITADSTKLLDVGW